MFEIDHALKLHDEVDRRLGIAERVLTDSFITLGILKPEEKGHHFDSLVAPKVDKYAAAMVIANQADIDNLYDPYQFRIVGQLMFVDNTFYGTKQRRLAVAMPGGAMRSKEEVRAMDAGEIPDNDRDRQRAFYFVGENQLRQSGKLVATYDFSNGWGRLVEEAMVKIQREMGQAALSNCGLLDVQLSDPKISILPQFNVITEEGAADIAKKLHEEGVELVDAEPGKRISLKGIYTRVTEGVLIAGGQVGQVVENAAQNELQARMRIFSMGELIRLLEEGGTIDGLTSYRERFPADGHQGPRNPSLAFQLRRFVNWWGQKVLERDTYREGPRVMPSPSDEGTSAKSAPSCIAKD